MTSTLSICIAYIGPETILPLASVIAAIGGVVLMCWNSTRRVFTWCYQKLRRGSTDI